MSDENEKKNEDSNEEKKKGGWADPLGAIDPITKMMAALNRMEDLLNPPKTKPAIDLAPGDVITIGHRSIFLTGVSLRELDDPATRTIQLSVQAAGAHAWYQSNDWVWSSTEVMYDSLFLRFHPSQEVVIERESPSGTNTLDQLLAMREKLHKEREEEKKKWEEAGKEAKSNAYGWGDWMWGKADAYSSKVEKEDKDESVDERG